MKRFAATGIALAFLAGAMGCSGNATEKKAANAPAEQTMTVEAQAWMLVRGGALLVDVRTPGEFEAGHLAGALNIPYDQIESRRAEFGDDLDRAIVVYCRSGRRSGIALDTLEKLGYTAIFNGGSYNKLRAAR